MVESYNALAERLRDQPRRWLVTGVAGFIGSSLLQRLLELEQEVVGLDNFSTGYQHNLDDVRRAVGEERWARFRMIEGDICALETCREACAEVDVVLHQAALGSVPRSIDDPLRSHASNVDGFVNMLVAARDAGVQRFVYAASSSTYGDHPKLPKVEHEIGNPLSPYAVTKYVNELYAQVFGRCYGMQTIGLRYFNVFGPRQDPGGAYAAVIPRWIGELLHGEPCTINGDGSNTRDFCFVENAVQANLLAGCVADAQAINEIYNVAVGEQTSLNELYAHIAEQVATLAQRETPAAPVYGPFRAGDVPHSLADIEKARRLLGYAPAYTVGDGLVETVRWFVERSTR